MSPTTESPGFDSEDGRNVSDVIFDEEESEIVGETCDGISQDIFLSDSDTVEADESFSNYDVSTPTTRCSQGSELCSVNTPRKDSSREEVSTPTSRSFRKRFTGNLRETFKLLCIPEDSVSSEDCDLKRDQDYGVCSGEAFANVPISGTSTPIKRKVNAERVSVPKAVKPKAKFSPKSRVNMSLNGRFEVAHRSAKVRDIKTKPMRKKNTNISCKKVVNSTSGLLTRYQKTSSKVTVSVHSTKEKKRQVKFPMKKRNLDNIMKLQLRFASDEYAYFIYNCRRNSETYYRAQHKLARIFTGYVVGSNFSDPVTVDPNVPGARRYVQFMFDANKILHTRKFNEKLLKVYYAGSNKCAVFPVNNLTTVKLVSDYCEWIFGTSAGDHGLYIDGYKLDMSSKGNGVVSDFNEGPWYYITSDILHMQHLSKRCSSALEWVPMFYQTTQELHFEAQKIAIRMKKIASTNSLFFQTKSRKIILQKRFESKLMNFYYSYSFEHSSDITEY